MVTNIADQVQLYMTNRIKRDAAWSDKFMLIILALHLPFIYFIIPNGYGTHIQGGVPATLIFVASVIAYFSSKGTLLSRAVIGTSFMIMSMIIIMQQMGRTEMHFHIFSALAFLTIWRDWKVIVIAALAIAGHHLVSVPLQLSNASFAGVPYTPFGQNCDWPTVFLHATFVVMESAILIFFSIRLKSQFVLANHIIASVTISATQKDLTINFQNIKTKSQDDKLFIESIDKFFTMVRDTIEKFQETSASLSTISTQSSVLATENQHQLSNQSNYISSIVTSVTEMSSTVSEIADSTLRTAQASRSAKTLSEKSNVQVHNTTKQMEQLTDQISSVKHVIDELAVNTVAISNATKIVDSIAEQTNLLALNAAIEAARAGEQGRGFAVVADEVRMLAMRSSDATKEITQVVTDLQTSANKAVNMMGEGQQKSLEAITVAAKTNKMLDEATQSIKLISEMSEQIAVAIEEQRTVAEQVSKDVLSIGESNANTQQKAKETNSISNDVSAMAEDLSVAAAALKVS